MEPEKHHTFRIVFTLLPTHSLTLTHFRLCSCCMYESLCPCESLCTLTIYASVRVSLVAVWFSFSYWPGFTWYCSQRAGMNSTYLASILDGIVKLIIAVWWWSWNKGKKKKWWILVSIWGYETKRNEMKRDGTKWEQRWKHNSINSCPHEWIGPSGSGNGSPDRNIAD